MHVIFFIHKFRISILKLLLMPMMAVQAANWQMIRGHFITGNVVAPFINIVRAIKKQGLFAFKSLLMLHEVKRKKLEKNKLVTLSWEQPRKWLSTCIETGTNPYFIYKSPYMCAFSSWKRNTVVYYQPLCVPNRVLENLLHLYLKGLVYSLFLAASWWLFYLKCWPVLMLFSYWVSGLIRYF